MTTPSFLLLLLSFLALVLNVSADDHHIQVPLGIPKTAALKYSRVLYQTEDERVTIYWEILDANASGNLTANIPQTFENEEDDDDDDDDDDHSTDTSAPSTTAVPGAQHWHAVLELVGAQDPVKTRAWVALGFGADTMLESQFIVCHQEQGSQISMNEHYSPEKYYPPPAANYPPLIKAVSGYYGNNTLACEFTRPLTHSDKNHIQINHLQPMSLLWSFNPASVRNYRGEWFFYHEPNHRGIVTTTLATGTIVPKAAKAIETKLFHGIGMLVVWLVLFPTAAFYARYRRSTPGWMLVHGTIQSVGVIAIFCFFGIILASHSKVDFTSTHGRLGISLLSLIVLQAIMGFLNFFAMRNESIARIKRVLKIYHTYAGDILIILAMVQAAYGIETVYPWAETKWRGRWLWIVYFILCLWWPIAFFCIELWYWRNIRKSQVRQVYAKTAVTDVVGVVEIKGDSKMDGLVKRKAVPKIVSDSPISTAGADGVQISLEGERLRPDVRAFTWELIGQEIAKGAMYVVANGRYVYDISKWISSHPGGQLILHAVNGTDITNDYFKPSGFDATEFVAKAGPPAQNPNRNKATLPRAAPAQVAGGLHPPTRPPGLAEIP
ncbi:S-methyl-5-thioribose-1-phosphate isomerase, partial [Borealophlyctis nickersoniae]